MKSSLAYAGLVLSALLFVACGSTEPTPEDAGVADQGASDLGNDLGSVGDFGIDAMSMPDLGDDANVDASDVDASEDPCGGACTAEETCCIQGLRGHCETLGDGGVCPLPDLTVTPATVMSTLSVQWEYIEPEDCTIMEGCVAAPGWRRLMRFATETPNIGDADLRVGAPSLSDPRFEYSSCHRHFHFVGYADYRLNNLEGEEVGRGHKQAFCLLDSTRYVDEPEIPVSERYTCEDQGIQRGWSDVYTANLDCQWVDVTDVAPGDYSLHVSINYTHVMTESNYDNNEADVPVTVPPEEVVAPLTPCTEDREGLSRECGWTLAGTDTCTPGDMIQVACGTRCGLGTCSGDPVLRVCAGSEACGARDALDWDDDSCGRQCPSGTFTCPSSGSYTVLTAPYDSSDEYTCVLAQRIAE